MVSPELNLPDKPRLLSSRVLREAGFVHAFFTRDGGVSEAPFASLNTSASSGDDLEKVRENVARIEQRLGLDAGALYFPSQVHGVDIVRVTGAEPREEVLARRADIVVSGAKGVGCGVRSADCGTVLVADRRSGAVAAIHSGWRGTVQDVVAVGIRALRSITSDEAELVAAIGPHIEKCCFEVGDEVAAELAACSSAGRDAIDRTRARPHVDLRAILQRQLASEGITEANIDHVRGCTVCDAASFYSFRRDGDRSGRLMAAIVTRA